MAKSRSKARKKSAAVKAKVADPLADTASQSSSKSSDSTTSFDSSREKTETPNVSRRSVAKEAQKSVAAQLEEHKSKSKPSESLDNDSTLKKEDTPKTPTPTAPVEGMQLRRSHRKVTNRVIPGAASPDQTFNEVPPTATPKKMQPPPQPRKIPGGHFIELMMECTDDELSSYQIDAHKKANDEYLKAKKLIDAAKTGQLVINGSRTKDVAPGKTAPEQIDEDLIIVGETPPKHPPQLQPQAKVQPQLQVQPHSQVQPQPQLIQNKQIPLQPPRPQIIPRAPFSQNQMRGNHQTVTRQTLATPPTRTQLATRLVNPQQVQFTNANPVSGVFPQQVYKFVNVQNPSQPLGGQWTIRPLVKVMPQQAQQGPGNNNQQIIHSQKNQKQQQQPVVKSPEKDVQPQLKVAGSLFGQKKVSDPVDLLLMKRNKVVKKTELDIGPDKWVPLDEYYYGKMEGDRSYSEEKGEYRFKCWYCMKMLYNNVRTMMHVQGHIDSEKQQNIDLSDLTQCKHCYKQFDTPFEMQTHVEKVHLNASNVLMCRICEKDLDNRNSLTSHMRNLHNACEMPYICPLCNFRSSMYIDVVDHFKKKHDSSQHLLCLYCLKIFNVKFVMNGWAQTKNYYHHLLKHQSKSTSKKCPLCKLTFINVHDMVAHKKRDHQSNIQKSMASKYQEQEESDQVLIRVPQSGLKPSKESKMQELKSLNAPAVSKVKDYYGIKMADEIKGKICYECTMPMNAADHYKKHVECVMCRFATSCSYAYASHMMGFHSGQMTSLNLNIPWERPMEKAMYCLCGFGSKYGNKIATHLVYCTKRTCYSTVQDVPQSLTGKETSEPRPNNGANLLDVLGLVKKQNIIHTDRSSSDRDVGTSKEEQSGSSSLRGKRTRTAPAEIHSVKKFKPLDVMRRSSRGKKDSDETKDKVDDSEIVVIDDTSDVDTTKMASNKVDESHPTPNLKSTEKHDSVSCEKETKDSAALKNSETSVEKSNKKLDIDRNSPVTVVEITEDVSDTKKNIHSEKCPLDAKGDASVKCDNTSISIADDEEMNSSSAKKMEVESNEQLVSTKESHENKGEEIVRSKDKCINDTNDSSDVEIVDKIMEENESEAMEIEGVVKSTSEDEGTEIKAVFSSVVDSDKTEIMDVDDVSTKNITESTEVKKDITDVDGDEITNSKALLATKTEDTDTAECVSDVMSVNVDQPVDDIVVSSNKSVIKTDDLLPSTAAVVSISSSETRKDQSSVSPKNLFENESESSEHISDKECSTLDNSSAIQIEDLTSELEKTKEVAHVPSPVAIVSSDDQKECVDGEEVKTIFANSEKVTSTVSDEFSEKIADEVNSLPETSDCCQNSENKELSPGYKGSVMEEKTSTVSNELSGNITDEVDISLPSSELVSESSDFCQNAENKELSIGYKDSVIEEKASADSKKICENSADEMDIFPSDKLETESSDHCNTENNELSIGCKDSVRDEIKEGKTVIDDKESVVDKSDKSHIENTVTSDSPGTIAPISKTEEKSRAASTSESKNKEPTTPGNQQSYKPVSASPAKHGSTCEQKPSPSYKTPEKTSEKSWEKHSRSDDRSRERYDRDRSEDRSRDRGSYSRDNRDYRSSYSGNDHRSHGGNYHRDGGYHRDNRDSERYGRNDNYHGNRQRHDRYDHHSDRYDRSHNDHRRDYYNQQRGGYRSGYR